ncbi:hypothetical protein HOLleu_25756 [Holothuria leucospilota]|uniref:Calx-beta domain-containing protein n=1 Tax=Holothuria leucospilota TaxID=206669 RepID=A0A9Q1BTB2_HOLLE|nr:hypothetical protein HOLleu_25756 [Holothuria leucospilota]
MCFRIKYAIVFLVFPVVVLAQDGPISGFEVEPEDNDQYRVSKPTTIGAGSLCSRVSVTARHDTVIEPTQTFVVTLVSTSSGASVNESANTLTVDVIDDDVPVYIQFERTNLTIFEADSGDYVRTEVCIHPPIVQTYTIWMGFEVEPEDNDQYRVSTPTSIGAGSLCSRVSVTARHDTVIEPTQTFVVTLVSTSSGASVNESANTLTVDVIDDDVPVVIQFEDTELSLREEVSNFWTSVCLSPPIPRVFSTTFALHVNPSETADLIVIKSGEIGKKSLCTMIKITIVDDTIPETDEKMNITLSSTSAIPVNGERNTLCITIVDNDILSI